MPEVTPMKIIVAASDLLDQVADSSLDANAALERWPLPLQGVDRLLIDAWAHLQHFADDADIRWRDRDYFEAQIARLRDFASRMRLETARALQKAPL